MANAQTIEKIFADAVATVAPLVNDEEQPMPEVIDDDEDLDAILESLTAPLPEKNAADDFAADDDVDFGDELLPDLPAEVGLDESPPTTFADDFNNIIDAAMPVTDDDNGMDTTELDALLTAVTAPEVMAAPSEVEIPHISLPVITSPTIAENSVEESVEIIEANETLTNNDADEAYSLNPTTYTVDDLPTDYGEVMRNDHEDVDLDAALDSLGINLNDGLLHNNFSSEKNKLLTHLLKRFEALARKKLQDLPNEQVKLIKSVMLRVDIELKFGEFSTSGDDDSIFQLDL